MASMKIGKNTSINQEHIREEAAQQILELATEAARIRVINLS
jgi:hypothetical protein